MLIILNEEITTLWVGRQGNRGSIPGTDTDYLLRRRIQTAPRVHRVAKLVLNPWICMAC